MLHNRWQYQGHRCCPRKKTTTQKLKKSRSYILQTAKKPRKLNFDDNANVVSKSGTNGNHEYRSKRYLNKKSNNKKDLEHRKKSGEKISFP